MIQKSASVVRCGFTIESVPRMSFIFFCENVLILEIKAIGEVMMLRFCRSHYADPYSTSNKSLLICLYRRSFARSSVAANSLRDPRARVKVRICTYRHTVNFGAASDEKS